MFWISALAAIWAALASLTLSSLPLQSGKDARGKGKKWGHELGEGISVLRVRGPPATFLIALQVEPE